MSFSIFKKLALAPLTKVGRISLFFKDDGLLYSKDGTGTEILVAGSAAWPIGSIFMAAVSTNPATLMGFGTWARYGEGRMPISQDSTNARFDGAEETGGSETVALTVAQLAVHTHIQDTHGHTQNPHGHVQDPHGHVQDSHAHSQDVNTLIVNVGVSAGTLTGTSGLQKGQQTQGTVATNQNTTATNQSTTATNQSTVATNQNAGSGDPHDNMPPYIVVYMWKRTA